MRHDHRPRPAGPRRVLPVLLVAALAACTSPSAPAPTAAPAPAVASPAPTVSAATPAAPAPAVLIGAGDIASCDSDGDSRTLALLRRSPGTVFTLGDNAYPDGSRRDFRRCYGPTWGQVKARTRPVAGNHDYRTRGAAPYFDYFGAAAGPRGRGYYSYEAGAWHVVVLNSNCTAVPGGCGPGSAQQRWLRADLAAHPAVCTVAMMHSPLFTSAATHPPATEVRPLVRTLYDAGVELMLAGHNHVYERFAPQTPTGRRDPARGIRAIVVGTGGAALYPFGRPAPNSQVRDDDTFGVLRLTLGRRSYRWDFLSVAGGDFTDSGTGDCH
ncbi:metallophosphoesterase family protein [Actinoplanes nipponensis]|uniref:metallophosphoesterase family protein n=1 Tax=Actinoplanes nipponensis TaxID=135950 RepID=UPI001940717C|nr:metallophosphoesterase [Actinoplanes nipponensis]